MLSTSSLLPLRDRPLRFQNLDREQGVLFNAGMGKRIGEGTEEKMEVR